MMQKIRYLNVGQTLDMPLVVANVAARETKAKKPFLQLTLYDGTDTIMGMYWDWAGKSIPDKNSILDVKGQVTEYNGVKQLNIKSITTNTTRHLSEFSPNSGVDVSSVYKDAYALASQIKDGFLRSISLELLDELRNSWLKVPGAINVHHAFVGGTLVHSLSVAKIALAISRQIPESNDDLCIAGGLLHDIGKLFTYKLYGVTIDMTDEGKLYDHIFIGAEFVGNFAEGKSWYEYDLDCNKLAILRHIILSHHGALEYGSPVMPSCIEACIVSHADGVDAATQQIIEQSRKLGDAKWTDRIYAFGNRQCLTTQYVRDVFLDEE